MIEQTDSLLKDWVVRVLGTVPVTLSFPATSQAGPSVSLYLMALAPGFPSNGGPRPPAQLGLRYLVTTWADAPEQAHRMLGRLAFAAMDSSEFEVDLDPLPVEVWLAFATAPRPAFVLRVLLRLERPKPDKFVRVPLVVRSAPLTALRGRVLSPEGVPLPGLRVDLPSLQLSTQTDEGGHFLFPAIPSESPIGPLHISGKGHELDITLERPADEPIVIHFNPLGEKGA